LENKDGFIPVLEEKELQDGKMKIVTVEGIPILIIKQHSKIFVIDNRCPHQGCGLSGGILDGFVIVCPCHEWRLNLEKGEYEEEPFIKLTMFNWKSLSGKIWINLEDET
jgi:nitrite reductase/ring-hydroxylating ferredoxin subunit